jgi:hypothetical protein
LRRLAYGLSERRGAAGLETKSCGLGVAPVAGMLEIGAAG